MTRTPRTIANTNKRRGAMVERVVADHLAKHTGLAVEPRRLAGAADRGDLAGLPRIVVEVKSGKPCIPAWLRETETERRNADAIIGVLWWAPPGHARTPDRHVVFVGVDDLMILDEAATFDSPLIPLKVPASQLGWHTHLAAGSGICGFLLDNNNTVAVSGLHAATEWNWKVFA